MRRGSGPSARVRLVVALVGLLAVTACGADDADTPSPSSAPPSPTTTIAVGEALPDLGLAQAELLVGDGVVFVAVDGTSARVQSATGAELPGIDYRGDVCAVAAHTAAGAREIVVAAVSELTGKDANGFDRVTLHLVVHDARTGEEVHDVTVGDEASGLAGHCADASGPSRLDFSLDGRHLLLAGAPLRQGGVLLDLDTGDVTATAVGQEETFQALVGAYLLRATPGATTIEVVDPATGADGPAVGSVATEEAPFDQLRCDDSPRDCVDVHRQTTATGDLVLTAPTGIQVGVPVAYALPTLQPRYAVPLPDGTTVQRTGGQTVVEPVTGTIVAMGLQDGGGATLVAYDAAGGTRLWVTPTTGFVDFCAAANGQVLIALGDRLVLVDPRSGAQTPAADDRNCPADLGGGFGYDRDDQRIERYF